MPEGKKIKYPIGPGPYIRGYEKQSRNEKCKCGSGLKYKKCCGKRV